ncbi:MAG TPA: DUF2490 domain-containing protein [Flavisolibacter sp.]|jgi:hypothetical protein|nr:DUF2490 domain-containing protein [Flavisolibacter sp.]
MLRLGILQIVIFCLLSSSVIAQNQQSGWLASFNTFRIDPKWSVHFDAQLRSGDALKNVQSILLRPGLNYHLRKNLTATIGYAWINNRRTIGPLTEMITEHRIWEQLLLTHRLGSFTPSHRFRLEQRFLPVVVSRNNELKVIDRIIAQRFRYFLRNIFPLPVTATFTKGPFLALQNEVFLNLTNKDDVNGSTFDQNRFYAAAGYRLPVKIDLEVGYMNQYTKGRTSNLTNHIIQLAVYKRL